MSHNKTISYERVGHSPVYAIYLEDQWQRRSKHTELES